MTITESQATTIMDEISTAVIRIADRTVYLTGGQYSTLVYLTPEIEEETRECFKKICEIIDIEGVEIES